MESTSAAVLIHGQAGWGEFSPFAEYDDAEAAAWWRAARRPPASVGRRRFARQIPVNATVPAVPAAEVAAVMAAFPGCGTAKVKIAEPGQTAADDQARLEAVRDASALLGISGSTPTAAGSRPGGAVSAAVRPSCGRSRVCRTTVCNGRGHGCAAAPRRRPIAADESIRRSDDPIRVARLGAADVAVLKVQPMGGVSACLRLAEELGLPVVVSSALETSVGIGAGVALAAALPELPFACGLGTAALLSRDVVDDPLCRSAGPPGAAAGAGSGLAGDGADEVTAGWWRDRARRAAKLA